MPTTILIGRGCGVYDYDEDTAQAHSTSVYGTQFLDNVDHARRNWVPPELALHPVPAYATAGLDRHRHS